MAVCGCYSTEHTCMAVCGCFDISFKYHSIAIFPWRRWGHQTFIILTYLISVLLFSEILGLMSPVHRSNSNMDTSGSLLAAGALAAEQNSTHQLHYHRSYNCRPEDTGGLDSQSMQRSNSMPPSMFEVDGAVFLASERGTAPGHGQGSYRGHLRQRMLESQSEDELTTSGGREGDVEDSGEALEEGSGAEEGRVRILDGSYPRGRRNAFRGGTRLVRRATCAADGSIASAATVARHNAAATLEEETRTGYVLIYIFL